MRHLLYIALIAPSVVFGAASPEAVVREYTDALARRDWRAAVNQFNAADLKRMRSAVEKQIRRPGSNLIVTGFFKGMSVEQIAQLGDAEFCEKLLFAYFTQIEKRGVQFEIKPASILGVIPEGNKAYVVTKQIGVVNGRELEAVEATPVMRSGAEWSIEVPTALETLFAMWEDSARGAEAGCHDIGACVTTIQKAVTRNWVRLVDRPGLKVKLKVALDEDATVKGVSIETSSGDTEFDESAVSAVRRTSAFTELRGLDRDTFERNFRIFYFTFAPD